MTKKRIIRTMLTALTAVCLMAAACGRNATVKELSIVPEPVFVLQKEGTYILPSSPKMSLSGTGQNSPTVKYIMKSMRAAHFHPSLVSVGDDSDISLIVNDTANPELGTEGYLLEVRSTGLTLSANSETGLFYAYQTLCHILPPDVVKNQYRNVTLPECTILDYPRFEWRGICLSDSVGFLGQKEMKRIIEAMASYKMNRLIWNTSPTTDRSDAARLANYASERGIRLIAHGANLEEDSLLSTLFLSDNGFYSGLEAARDGRHVVMSPPDYCALDRYQADARYQPPAEVGMLTLARAYAFDPIPQDTPRRLAAAIVGGQGMYTCRHRGAAARVEYMLLPRMLALSECLWSPREKRNWNTFRRKTEVQKDRLGAKGYSYCEGSFTPLFSARKVNSQTMNISISTEVPNTYIFYTTDLSTPTRESPIYIGPINLQRGTHIKILPVYKGEERDSVYEFLIK